jgi:hypothetical protein
MDILVRERGGGRAHPAGPGEARTWGSVAVAVVLGLVLMIAAFEWTDHRPARSDATVLLKHAPAPLIPERALP